MSNNSQMSPIFLLNVLGKFVKIEKYLFLGSIKKVLCKEWLFQIPDAVWNESTDDL